MFLSKDIVPRMTLRVPSLMTLVFMAEYLLFLGITSVTSFEKREFNVYWNVPTFMCHKYKINFDSLDKYGIIQNDKDEFRGNKIAILYDPGMFPALLKDSKGRVIRRNGGVPQEGNITKHLDVFVEHLTSQIPQKTFDGVGVIDFESWRPIFRQNWASLSPYKHLSITLVHRKHPNWSPQATEKEAKKNFEKYGRLFMEETLKYAKKHRPLASWGYYAYPYCYNLTPNQPVTECSSATMAENNRLSWLFDAEDVLLPSLYLRSTLTLNGTLGLIEGRINEAKRVAVRPGVKQKILPYFWYNYQDQSHMYLNRTNLEATLRKIADLGTDGVILWGSSDDINTKEKCVEFSEYLEQVLGPTIYSIRQAALNEFR